MQMNGVVKSDPSDSTEMGNGAERTGNKGSLNESAVIQPPGIGPAIHLNGSAVNDQPGQVPFFIQLSYHGAHVYSLVSTEGSYESPLSFAPTKAQHQQTVVITSTFTNL